MGMSQGNSLHDRSHDLNYFLLSRYLGVHSMYSTSMAMYAVLIQNPLVSILTAVLTYY